ncbi:MAG TPA: DUF308 domain-containing protein [Coriobacteriia bacterium]
MASIFYTSDAGSLRHTWVPLVASGVLVAAFGIVVALEPVLTASALVFLMGLGSIIAGLVWVSWAISLRAATGGWWTVTFFPGLLLLLFGVYALLRPEALAVFLLRATGALVALGGLADMAASWRWRSFFAAWWLRLLRGLLVATIGVLVFLMPLTGLATAGLLLGLGLLVIGAVTIALGFAAWRLPKNGATVIVNGQPTDRGPLPLA